MNRKGWLPVILLFGVALSVSVVLSSAPDDARTARVVLSSLYLPPIVFAGITLGTRGAMFLALASGVCHVIVSSIRGGDGWIRLLIEAALFVCVGVLVAKISGMRHGLVVVNSAVHEAGDESLESAFRNPAVVRQMPDFGQIVGGLVRRFRTPVASIDGALWLLDDPRLSPEKHEEFVKIIRRESHHMERALSDLQEFTQPRRPRIRPVEISRLLDEIVQLTGPREHRNLFLFRIELEPYLPPLNCDPELITKVLLNLAINAIQAMPEGGQLVWTVRVIEGRMIISVRDFGRGILPGIRDRIFDPFFSTRENGLGLGLTVARQIVVAHGGTIALEDISGRGTSVAVTLPLDPPIPH